MIKQLLELVKSMINYKPIYGNNMRGCGKDVIYIYIPSTSVTLVTPATSGLDVGFYSVCMRG